METEPTIDCYAGIAFHHERHMKKKDTEKKNWKYEPTEKRIFIWIEILPAACIAMKSFRMKITMTSSLVYIFCCSTLWLEFIFLLHTHLWFLSILQSYFLAFRYLSIEKKKFVRFFFWLSIEILVGIQSQQSTSTCVWSRRINQISADTFPFHE